MDITLTDEQRMLQETAAGFARDVSSPARTRALEAESVSYDRDVWASMAELGLAGASLPARYGGSELGMLELGLIVEALAASALPTPIFASVVEAGLLLADCASEEQQEKWLPAISAGAEVLTVAYLEARRDFLPLNVETRLLSSGAGFVLEGTKSFVRDAGSADALVCSALSESGELVLAVVPREDEGVRLERLPAAGGESLWVVHFDRTGVAPESIVRGNSIADALGRLARRGAALKARELVGIGQAALDLTVDYAKNRKQFGVPIGSFQAVQHHCAEIFRDISVTRLLARKACATIDLGQDAQREVSFAKAKASEAMPAATRTAHQIHGAVAYYRDYPLELYYHRAIAAQSAYGNAMHHKRILGEMLASNPGHFRGISA